MNKNEIKTIADLVKNSAKEYGGKTFLKEVIKNEVAEKTFEEFYSDIRKFFGYIKNKYGEKVHTAVIGPSSYGWLVSWFGTVSGGSVAVPLDAQLSPEDICELLVRSDTDIFCYDGRYEKMIPAVKANCKNVKECISFDELPALLENAEQAELPDVSADSLAAIVYTSGTTGKSKGVMLLNSNYIDNTMCQDNEATPEDTVLSVLPIHHIYCFTCDILMSLRYGSTLCFNDSMMHIPQNLKRFAPTIMLIVPMIAETMYKQIKAAAAQKPEIPIAMIAQSVFGGRLKTIYSGGAYLRPELQKAYVDMGFNMAQGYGMTECAPRISTADPGDKTCAGDVGVIVNGCEVKTVDGEILVKSPSVMAGYYKDEAATAEALTPDGWLRTGDLGYADENRKIFITGRKKNLIILSNGENVSPEELENKFAGFDVIGDVLVYSDDSVITAEIFPAPEAAKAMSEEEIEKKILETVDGVNKTVSSAKAIRRVLLRAEEFEKTTSKKIKRNQPRLGKKIR
ncbi:MAG: AMP-binding protein [Ruminococcus sp.]|nr:AMP-binding protein [Ruminococcus sp.]MCM1381870.1 AMP-binding protein [Muribaculaceae bacterium]MCM1478736.1 AMP-binding protein [Muribaculaceae bacterium]